MKDAGKTYPSLLALGFIALLGIILFFPMELSDDHTCLFEKWSGGAISSGQKAIPVAGENCTDCVKHQLLRHYLLPFGFIWWFSVLSFVLVVVALKNQLQNSVKIIKKINQSEIKLENL